MNPSATPSFVPVISPLGVDPAAALFPMMPGAELDLLAEDIARNGLREPIVVHQGQILDGRNRLRACELAEVEPRFVEWEGDGSPIAFVLSRNLHRRHLNESQRSVIAARAKEMFKEEAAERTHARRFGSPAKATTNGGSDNEKPRVSPGGANLHRPQRSNAKAGTVLNVSARLVATATRLLAAGDEQLVAAVESGLVSVSDAAAILDSPKDQRHEALAKVRSGKFRTLQQAVEPPPRRAAPTSEHSLDDEPLVSPRQLRRACRRFAEGCERLCGDVDGAAVASGGPNDHTRRARECLAVAQRAMQSCLQEFG